MEEGHLQKFVNTVQLRLVLLLILAGLFVIGGQGLLSEYFNVDGSLIALGLSAIWLLAAVIIGIVLARSLTKPMEFIAQTILHISPSEHLVKPPNLEELKFGHELADTLSRQIYSYSDSVAHSNPQGNSVSSAIFNHLPAMVIGIDEKGNIALVNQRASSLFKAKEIIGQPLKNHLHFLSEEETTIDVWLATVGEKNLNDLKKWQKVEVKASDGTSLGYFDVAASFNKHNASGTETVFVLFDHSDVYDQEDDSMSLVSLAVHELRTPVTIMRGYIEAFRDELGPNLSPQLNEDLNRMSASAEILSSFVGNILNVSRINQGQLSLKLVEENWNQALPQIIDSLRRRAAVYGKTIELRMEPEMPMVAIDRMTISEVITNLIDNSIKYSPDNATKIIVVSRLNADKQIETTVQDFGIGIPSSVLPHLFSKFYRNHRTRASVGGTGLGLFLSKAIVTAHDGNIWVRSKENEGSIFGFTIMPFIQLDKEHQTNNNEGIIRSSHGWIKNHSLQRR